MLVTRLEQLDKRKANDKGLQKDKKNVRGRSAADSATGDSKEGGEVDEWKECDLLLVFIIPICMFALESYLLVCFLKLFLHLCCLGFGLICVFLPPSPK